MNTPFDFSLDQGTREDVVFEYRPDDVAFDLTGYTAECKFRRNLNSSTVDLAMSTANSLIGISGAFVTLKFFPANTATMVDSYVYDIVVTETADPTNVRKIASGKTSFNLVSTR